MSRKFDTIDALRGVAAFAVMVYHARVILGCGGADAVKVLRASHDPTGLFWLALTPFSLGGLGVDLFFVLSGYCIHSSMARQLAAGDPCVDWRAFFVRRFLRIYPAYIAALVISWSVGIGLIKLGHQSALMFDCSLLTLLGNLFTLQGLAVPMAAGNGALWTLSIEIHLYLFYPVMFFLARKYGGGAVALVALLLTVTTLVAVQVGEAHLHLNNWFAGGPFFTKYLFTWTVGCIIAEVQNARMPRPVWLGTAMGFFACGVAIALGILGLGPWAPPFIGIGLGVMLLTLLNRSGQAASPLPYLVTLCRRVGIYSYSLYLIHVPVLFAIGFLFAAWGRSIGVFILGVCSTLFVALLLHRWVESPFMKLRESTVPRPVAA